MVEKQSIKRFIVRDPHGHIEKEDSFSVVGEVHVIIDGGVGEPSAESEYADGELTITLHNLKGEGISDISFTPSEEDGGENLLTITTDGGHTYSFVIRNGSKGTQGDRGNGIASIETTESTEDGGTNTHTITDTDGNEHVFHTKNGHTGAKGDQGDSAIWTGEGEPWSGLKNTTGQSTTEPMTQKAVTEMGESLSEGMAEESLYWQRQATLPTDGFINISGNWYVADGYTHAHFSAEGVKFVKITGNAERSTFLAFLRSYTEPNTGEPADLCSDVVIIHDGATKMLEVPNDCAYIVVSMTAGVNSMAPQSVHVGRHIEKNADTLSAKEGTLRQRYTGCTLCIIGDSISTYQGDVPDGATYHYPQKGITSLDMMYYKRLVDNLGFKAYQNLSYGGSGAIRYDQSATHPSLFERAMLIREDTDVIIIELSVNDFAHQVPIGTPNYNTAIEEMDESTFCNAYIKGLKELMRKLPEAQIIPLLTEEVLDTNDNQFSIKMKDYQDAVRDIAAHYGFTVIDASHAYSTYGYMVNGSGDIHPRNTEMELLYNSCIDNLLANQNEGERKNKGENNEYLTPINYNLYPVSDYSLSATGLWIKVSNVRTTVINVEPNTRYRIQAKESNLSSAYILSTDNRQEGVSADFATGCSIKKAIVTPLGGFVDFITPADGHYLYVTIRTATLEDRSPQSISRVEEIDVAMVKAVADDYYHEGTGYFHLGGANTNDGTLDNTNTKLGRTDLVACSGILNISVEVPDGMSVRGAFLLKYNDGEFVEAVELDVSDLNYYIKVNGFTHAILRLYNANGYTIDQWSDISYSYTTGMKYLIGGLESDSVEDIRIDYIRSIQTKTKVIEIEDQEMIPTTGTCITAHDGHLYVSIDGVKYEITKTQVQ